MDYTTIASGKTDAPDVPKSLWGANLSDNADGLFIQNLSNTPLIILVQLDPVNGVTPPPERYALQGYCDWADESKIPLKRALSVVSPIKQGSFTANRTSSAL